MTDFRSVWLRRWNQLSIEWIDHGGVLCTSDFFLPSTWILFFCKTLQISPNLQSSALRYSSSLFLKTWTDIFLKNLVASPLSDLWIITLLLELFWCVFIYMFLGLKVKAFWRYTSRAEVLSLIRPITLTDLPDPGCNPDTMNRRLSACRLRLQPDFTTFMVRSDSY